MAFKIKTTAPKQYCVRPNSGRIEPGGEVEVSVLLQAMKEEPPADAKCRDKFLVQSTIITPEHESSSISVLWNAVEAKSRDEIHEKKIRCVYLGPESSQPGFSESAQPDHGAASDSYDAVGQSSLADGGLLTSQGSVPAYHAAETSTTDAQHYDTVSSQYPTTERSNVFKLDPALPSTGSQGDTTLSSQLQEAKQKIERLQKQLDSATSKKGDMKTTHNEGVPVPIAALIALIAFLAAYLLF